MQSDRGILVAADEHQEWMLPWWWKHYSAFNHLPVLFIDFGMSEEALAWCRSKGAVHSLSSPHIKSKEEISPDTVLQWQSAYGTGFWRARPSWFKKPLALIQTPFETTLWLDLDCEVKADLTPLFATLRADVALVPEPGYAHTHMRAHSICHKEETVYNSGVVLYRKASPLIASWANAVENFSEFHWSDQHLLSRLIFEQNASIDVLPRLYNWHMGLGENGDAHIVHWLGDAGKERIFMNLQ